MYFFALLVTDAEKCFHEQVIEEAVELSMIWGVTTLMERHSNAPTNISPSLCIDTVRILHLYIATNQLHYPNSESVIIFHRPTQTLMHSLSLHYPPNTQ